MDPKEAAPVCATMAASGRTYGVSSAVIRVLAASCVVATKDLQMPLSPASATRFWHRSSVSSRPLANDGLSWSTRKIRLADAGGAGRLTAVV
jgi:hypothetical protein